MLRAFIYLSLPLIYVVFWIVLLIAGYVSFTENNPFFLEGEYLVRFVVNRQQLLFSELIFPGAMLTAFLIVFIGKLTFRPIRLPLGIFALMSLEFFIYREFIFSDQYSDYHLNYEAGTPVVFMESTGYGWEIGILGIAFLLVVLVRESSEPLATPRSNY